MLKIVNKKRFIAFIAVVVLLIAGTVWGVIKFKNRNNPANQEQVYEALVNVVDQKTSDPVEDARSSLKKGDVIAYFPEGHNWSDTEKNSYLIVKLKLKAADAAKLMEAVTKEGKEVESQSTGAMVGKRLETVRARKYFLNLPEFDVQKFWSNQQQPFADKVFTSSIIDKK
jgi:hypothetical protein